MSRFGYPKAQPTKLQIGEGPFETIGVSSSVPLLVAFLVVCLAEMVVRWLLWSGHWAGVALSFALLPLELAFWIGLALPLGPVLGLLRTGLVISTARHTAARR